MKTRKLILLALFAWFAALWLKTLMRSARTGKAPTAGEWSIVEKGAGLVLWWAAFDAAARLLTRANRGRLIVPPFKGIAPSIDAVIKANSASAAMLRKVRRESFNVAKEWRESESKHSTRIVEQYREGTPARGDRSRTFPKFDASLLNRSIDYRVRRFKRDKASRVAAAAEQELLSDPEVAAMFPFAEYGTREDARVRPTHAAMLGFVAPTMHDIWQYVLPSCGWNCRCFRILRTKRECVARGWIKKDGSLKFTIHWPNTIAAGNYRRGIPYHDNGDVKAIPKALQKRVFPDPGPWMIARGKAVAL